MKKSIFAIVLFLFSYTAFSQKDTIPATSAAEKNTQQIKENKSPAAPADSLKILSLADLANFYNELQKISHSEYTQLTSDKVLIFLSNWASNEWTKKQPVKKNK